jgi:transposase-like protein
MQFVPHQTPCPQCRRVGLVRFENVIKGTKTSRLYYCGACDHEWSVEDAKPLSSKLPTPPYPSRPRSRTLGPKRRA